jgi:hypothetical protein
MIKEMQCYVELQSIRIQKLEQLLHDIMSLLMNHEQNKEVGREVLVWIKTARLVNGQKLVLHTIA